MLNLYIYYETTEEPWGGINSFMKALKNYIQQKRQSEVNLLDAPGPNMDVMLIGAASGGVNKEVDIKFVRDLIAKRDNLVNKMMDRYQFKFIHRLDGLRAIYSDAKVPSDDLQVELSTIADHIIFQSKYSLENFRAFGYRGDNYDIIFNGVDGGIFKFVARSFKQNQPLKLLSNSWSTAKNKGFETIVEMSQIQGVECYFIGRWNEELNPQKVRILGAKTQVEVAEIMTEMDAFLHAALNDPCPNVVLEAMASGLPVIHINSGGTPELAAEYGVQIQQPINTEALANSVTQLKDNYDSIVDKLERDREKFLIEPVAEKYLQVFKSVKL